jgi:hypothetical protein
VFRQQLGSVVYGRVRSAQATVELLQVGQRVHFFFLSSHAKTFGEIGRLTPPPKKYKILNVGIKRKPAFQRVRGVFFGIARVVYCWIPDDTRHTQRVKPCKFSYVVTANLPPKSVVRGCQKYDTGKKSFSTTRDVFTKEKTERDK